LKMMTWPSIRRQGLHDVYLSLSHMEFDATEPTPFEVGSSKTFENYDIKYEKMTQEGEAGKAGTKFGALLKITDHHTTVQTVANPKIVVGGGMEKIPAMVGKDYFVTLEGMNAASKQVTIQLHFMHPMYWGELFIKPFTILVWLGTGILTLGSLITAFYRRNRAETTNAVLEA